MLAVGSVDGQQTEDNVSSALCVYEISNVSIYNINTMGEDVFA